MSEPNDQEFLDEIYQMLDLQKPAQPGPRGPRTPPRRPPRKRRRRFPWLALLLLLLGCGLAFALLQSRQAAQTPPSTTAPTLPASQAQDGDVLTIAAGGDVTITQALLDDARQPDGSYDFSSMLLQASPLLAGADLAVANLEVNFCGSPYEPDRYNAPESLLTALSGAGLDLGQTANSMSIYNGIAGLQSTLEAVRAAGLEPLGTFADQAEFQRTKGVTVLEVKGFRVAFVAFTKGLDNLKLPAGSENCVNLLYKDYNTTYRKVDTEAIRSVLSAAQAQKPDVTIALLHWGSEYDQTISKTQEEIRDLMFSQGVDVILGTHSHLVGPVEVTTVQDKDRLTAYSLGNLLSTDQEPGANQGLVLQLEFTKSDGQTKLTSHRYVPIYLAQGTETDTGKFQVLNTLDAIALYESDYIGKVSEETYQSLTRSAQKIAELVQPTEPETA